jgi:hypothetical protein
VLKTLWAMPDGETVGLAVERDPNVSRDLLVLRTLIQVEDTTRARPNRARLVRDAMSDDHRPASYGIDDFWIALEHERAAASSPSETMPGAGEIPPEAPAPGLSLCRRSGGVVVRDRAHKQRRLEPNKAPPHAACSRVGPPPL